jgi:phosphatidylserine/phosphatidylglycerophosphate/cardiolipin synthase-like enzyme
MAAITRTDGGAMTDEINRRETTHVDATSGTAKCTAQWLLENRNIKGKVTHPITHNNKLTMFICGEEGFADIAKEIRNAKESIDLCCWGFDPAMELVRSKQGTWPRGETYGDLLIAAGKRDVKVRLLVWFDWVAKQAKKVTNMPGYTHDELAWRIDGGRKHNAERISAKSSLGDLRAAIDNKRAPDHMGILRWLRKNELLQGKEVPMQARKEYCASWYQAAFSNLLSNVEIRIHSGDIRAIHREMAMESMQPSFAERGLMEGFGSHHQKPILIDFHFDKGSKAIGYVMGLNSVTDYWDSVQHVLEDGRRESTYPPPVENNADPQRTFDSIKPFQDYACRIDTGGALVSLYNNFVSAWHRAGPGGSKARLIDLNRNDASFPIPECLLHKPEAGDSTVQILRTQPTEKDHSIQDIYFKAADNASLAFKYIYVENQYFQYEEWCQRLLKKRQEVMKLWSTAAEKKGTSLSDMPLLHIFIVIPMPEIAEMIPRTYDALATLGQHETLEGQEKLIKSENDRVMGENFAAWHKRTRPLPDAIAHANQIDKPNFGTLRNKFGVKISTAMLNTYGKVGGKWRYREIYIHSKLLLVDDIFCTLGSANLNQRSMVGDSELNMATIDHELTKSLRKKIWLMLSGGSWDGADCSKSDIEETFYNWNQLMLNNLNCKKRNWGMVGFLLPLLDARSSTTRYG